MKKQIIFLITFLISLCGFGQEISKLSYDSKILEGTWVATSGNKSYEITFIKGTAYLKKIKITLETMYGSIKYMEDNKVIKSTDISSLESIPIFVSYSGIGWKFEISYSEFGNGKRINGQVKFDIDADGTTAHWYSLYKTRLIDTENYAPKEDFDIPKELIFTKKPLTKSQSSNQPTPHFEFP
ncbi:MAG: hypothetical protein LBT43_21250 [Prevotella sp.]|jgi:hypothetical protein|nr:hypothetical protein [Prevotella sp.]